VKILIVSTSLFFVKKQEDGEKKAEKPSGTGKTSFGFGGNEKYGKNWDKIFGGDPQRN
jgi:hypothetical protein